MALASYARNLYGPQKAVDINLVFVKIGASGRVAADSSPETGVTDNADGTYDVTFPKGVTGFVVGAPAVVGQAGTAAGEVTAFDPTAGTLALDVGAASLAGTDTCHLVIALFNQ